MSDLDLPPPREEKDVGAHLFALLRDGGDHHRRGILEGASVRIWVEEAGGGDLKTFGVENGGFEVDEQPLGVVGRVAKG